MRETVEEVEETVEDVEEAEEAETTEEAKEAEEIGKEEEEEEEIVEEAKEEKEPEKLKKREAEEEWVEEKVYTIPLGRAWISPRKKRAPKAIRLVKAFVQRHMKLKLEAGEEEEAERLVISDEVNRRIWSRGIEKPPRKIRVRAAKDKEGTVTLYLAEGD